MTQTPGPGPEGLGPLPDREGLCRDGLFWHHTEGSTGFPGETVRPARKQGYRGRERGARRVRPLRPTGHPSQGDTELISAKKQSRGRVCCPLPLSHTGRRVCLPRPFSSRRKKDARLWRRRMGGRQVLMRGPLSYRVCPQTEGVDVLGGSAEEGGGSQ